MTRRSHVIDLENSTAKLYIDPKSYMLTFNDYIRCMDGTFVKVANDSYMFPAIEYGSSIPKSYITTYIDFSIGIGVRIQKNSDYSLRTYFESEPCKYSVYPTGIFKYNGDDYMVCQLEWFLDYSTDTYFSQFMDPNNPVQPVYSEIWLYKMDKWYYNRIIGKKLISRHFQSAMDCCGPDTRTNVSYSNKQYPGGIYGDISLGIVETDDYIYFPCSRIMSTRNMLYNASPPNIYGYPPYLCKHIEATPGMSAYYQGNMIISRLDKKDMINPFSEWKLNKYYYDGFSSDGIGGYSTALLDRSESYGRVFTIEKYPNSYFYISQKWQNGFDLFISSDMINWEYKCNLPFDVAYHPNVIESNGRTYLIYCKRIGLPSTLQYFTNEISFDKDIDYSTKNTDVNCVNGISGVSGVPCILISKDNS